MDNKKGNYITVKEGSHMVSKKLDVKFYYDKQLFVSVKIPVGYKPTVYMNCGTDNRPYADIVNDIKLAIELLDNEVPRGFLHDVTIANELPKLLGYCRSNAALK
jgi:hypothetical protein